MLHKKYFQSLGDKNHMQQNEVVLNLLIMPPPSFSPSRVVVVACRQMQFLNLDDFFYECNLAQGP